MFWQVYSAIASERAKTKHTFRTRFALRRKPWAETARLSERTKSSSWVSASRAITFWHRDGRVGEWLAKKSQKKPTCFILQRVKSLLTLDNLGDIIPHDVDGVIDLGLNASGLGVPSRASVGSSGVGWWATTGKIRVIRFRPGLCSRVWKCETWKHETTTEEVTRKLT